MMFNSELKAVSVWFQNKRRPTTVNRVPIATIYTSKDEGETISERTVLGNVVNNFSPSIPQTPRHVTSDFSPDPEDVDENTSIGVGLWDLLPSSSPASNSDSFRFDDDESDGLVSPADSPIKRRKKSLEWACKHDASIRGKMMKRRIRSFLSEANKMSVAMCSPARKRQRTDMKPSQPSPKLQRQLKRPDNFRRLTIAATVQELQNTKVDRDVFDVAVALIQLKGHEGMRPMRGRKSI